MSVLRVCWGVIYMDQTEFDPKIGFRKAFEIHLQSEKGLFIEHKSTKEQMIPLWYTPLDLVHCVCENEEMFDKVAEKLGTIALGNFNTRKVEGFKIDAKKHLYGNLKHDVNRHISELI